MAKEQELPGIPAAEVSRMFKRGRQHGMMVALGRRSSEPVQDLSHWTATDLMEWQNGYAEGYADNRRSGS